MNEHVKHTKQKLAIIFSVVIFFVIFVLWSVFFVIKYINQITGEKRNFTEITSNLETWKMSYQDIIENGNRFDKDLFNRNRDTRKNDVNLKSIDMKRPFPFINYILLDTNSSIVQSSIHDDIDEKLLLSIQENDIFLSVQSVQWFFIKKIIIPDQSVFILFSKQRYSLSDLFNDMFLFLSVTFLFSVIFYFISYKFVHRAFVPVEENMKDMNDFIHNAWHELKTPISVIDSNIQIMDDIKEYDAEMTQELKDEVKRLNSIIEWLIKLSNIHARSEYDVLVLEDIINEILKEYSLKINDKNIQTKVFIPSDVTIKTNKDYFYIFLSNIIGNAIKYNNNWWQISISYKSWELFIEDNGVGIDNKNIEKIFDRFFKEDTSRNSEGFWIGLSLVQKIAKIYKWKIKVESQKGKGTTFKIQF